MMRYYPIPSLHGVRFLRVGLVGSRRQLEVMAQSFLCDRNEGTRQYFYVLTIRSLH